MSGVKIHRGPYAVYHTENLLCLLNALHRLHFAAAAAAAVATAAATAAAAVSASAVRSSVSWILANTWLSIFSYPREDLGLLSSFCSRTRILLDQWGYADHAKTYKKDFSFPIEK